MGLADKIKTNISKDPLRKVKSEAYAPDWVTGPGVWVGLGAIVVLLVVAIFTTQNSSNDTVAPNAQQVERAPEHINPYEVTPTEGSDGGSSTETPTSSKPKMKDLASFTSQTPITLAVVTSSLPSRAPSGAVAVGQAGALASATGEWSELPVQGTPPADSSYAGAQVDVQSAKLGNPIQEINDTASYVFVFDVTLTDGTETQLSVSVEPYGDSFRIIF